MHPLKVVTVRALSVARPQISDGWHSSLNQKCQMVMGMSDGHGYSGPDMKIWMFRPKPPRDILSTRGAIMARE